MCWFIATDVEESFELICNQSNTSLISSSTDQGVFVLFFLEKGGKVF